MAEYQIESGAIYADNPVGISWIVEAFPRQGDTDGSIAHLSANGTFDMHEWEGQYEQEDGTHAERFFRWFDQAGEHQREYLVDDLIAYGSATI